MAEKDVTGVSGPSCPSALTEQFGSCLCIRSQAQEETPTIEGQMHRYHMCAHGVCWLDMGGYNQLPMDNFNLMALEKHRKGGLM